MGEATVYDRRLRRGESCSDDLALGTNPGANYPLPERVPFTFAGRAQPVTAGGRVFIGDMDGNVYALALDDGRTLWVGANRGGTCAALGVAGDVVIATAIPGGMTGLDAATGQQRWHLDTPKAITGAPLVVGDHVFSGCHDGRVYTVDTSSGKLLWTSEDLGAPIVSDLCGDSAAVYVGAENMFFHKLDAAMGRVLAKTRLNGQSFRMLFPVLHQQLLFVQTVQPICVGSEYVMESVMRDSPDIVTEQTNILRWLSGDTNGGRWPDASPAWKHLFVLRAADLSEPFTVPNGPADGCGSPAQPPVVEREVPYWSRWTGDEGLGIPTELMAMIVPVERWVADASPATLASYTRSAPICRGDCYWLEALILAIEAQGTILWENVPP